MESEEPILLETLEVQGSPRDLGGAQGEHFRERVEAFVDMRLCSVSRYLGERKAALGGGPGLAQLREVGRKSMEVYRVWDPEGFEEHRGLAEAAHIDVSELHTVVQMTDMRDAVLLSAPSGEPLEATPYEGADAEGCSAVLIPGERSEDGKALVGQTWDLNPPDLAFVVAVHRKPNTGPHTWSVTCTGCLTLMGLSSRGVAVGTTNLKTYGAKPGVGYIAILHRAIRAASASEARTLVKEAPHAGAHSYWLADSTAQLELEGSPLGSFEREAKGAPIFRTNHCIAEEHIAIQGELPAQSSLKRFERLQHELDGANEHPINRESLVALFADRTDGVFSINRYPEDEQGTATNAVFIASPAEKQAWACRGPADRGQWRTLSF